MGNVFEGIPAELPKEMIETLIDCTNVRIERIVSKGHCSPEGLWYEQEEDEFVLVVKGAGEIEFADGDRVRLGTGDWVNIPAMKKHRVSWTEEGVETVWLGVFYQQHS